MEKAHLLSRIFKIAVPPFHISVAIKKKKTHFEFTDGGDLLLERSSEDEISFTSLGAISPMGKKVFLLRRY